MGRCNPKSWDVETIEKIGDLHKQIDGASFENMKPPIREFIGWYTQMERRQADLYDYYFNMGKINPEKL